MEAPAPWIEPVAEMAGQARVVNWTKVHVLVNVEVQVSWTYAS